MDIRTDDRRPALLGPLHAHARRRLLARLRHRGEYVHHVDVRLGPARRRSGVDDLYCLMRVQLRGAPAATVVDIGADPFETIDRAADRLQRLADQQLRAAAAPPDEGVAASS
ncbi:MAG: hypothetical protein KIT17_07980 [Rubrivivax sp.]|nr:hypothetical protein [Rubrivivax sp.]